MDWRKLHLVFVIFIAGIITLNCFAQQEETEAAEGQLNVAPAQEFPYFAQIVGDNVYFRSGPGTNFYRCGKLQPDEIVKIISASNVWSQIVPPAEAFSWISKQYVTIDASSPETGTVSGDEVRVYAGSQFYEPIHSDRVQLNLNRGDKVTLLGEEMGDYYKIVPPEGAFFWVSTQYTRPTDLTQPVRMPAVETQPQASPAEPQQTTELGTTESTTPAVVPTRLPEDSARLRQYYDIQEKVKAEFDKTLAEQNYSDLKQQLNKLIEADDSDKAAKYAAFTLGQIERCELAAKVEQQDKEQDGELEKIYQNIETKYQEKRNEFQDLGQFAVIGTFETSNVYGPEEVLLHYIINDERGKVICYALPTGEATYQKLDEFIGKKVGLIGKIEPHPQTAGALVKFTEIVPIK